MVLYQKCKTCVLPIKLTAADYEKVAFLADFEKEVLDVYPEGLQFPIAEMCINFKQRSGFIYFEFKNFKF